MTQNFLNNEYSNFYWQIDLDQKGYVELHVSVPLSLTRNHGEWFSLRWTGSLSIQAFSHLKCEQLTMSSSTAYSVSFIICGRNSVIKVRSTFLVCMPTFLVSVNVTRFKLNYAHCIFCLVSTSYILFPLP